MPHEPALDYHADATPHTNTCVHACHRVDLAFAGRLACFIGELMGASSFGLPHS
jgi:hypothetical protein